jgi:hypothetical protein
MTTYPAAGVGGSIKIGANFASNLDTWTVTPKGANKETTPFGAADSWAQSTATIKSWTVKLDGQIDMADAAQLALLNSLSSTFAVRLYIDDTYYWSGNARYDGGPITAKATDVVTVSYTLTGVGALVITSD